MAEAQPSVINNPVHFGGAVTFGDVVSLPAGTSTDSTLKLQSKTVANGKTTDAPVAWRQVIHRAYRAGTLVGFSAAMIGSVITGNATVTVDLYKNAVSVLTAVIVLDNANVLRTREIAGLVAASINFAANDVFEAVFTVAIGTGALGTGAEATITLYE